MAGKMRKTGLPYDYEIGPSGLVTTQQLFDWQATMLQRMAVADKASDDYERRKPGIEEHHRDRLIKTTGVAEDFALRKAMDSSWVLNDLLKKHAWNRDEANRFNLAILAQCALRQAMMDDIVAIDPQQMERLRDALR